MPQRLPESAPGTDAFTLAVMSRRERLVFGLLLIPWLAALTALSLWWFRPDHAVSKPGMALSTLLLAWTVLLPVWFFSFAARMRRPNPRLPIPPGAVAMIVTKAPSEPWEVVRRTLLGMLDQQFPRPYDVWLADEDPSEDVRLWCAHHGVRISCRKGVAGFHNAVWPARDRCKEGNLRYFYEVMGGYDRYDFVVQLDADHVPTPSYLAAMIRPFIDPGVGYVAAPSICDSNAANSWAARARGDAEATLHGPLQAGYSNGWAPLCIGSHYAVRTCALRAIGGLGPELAEDHTTTLMLNAHGWRGAFALDATARGEGPATFADAMTQELQWSRSLTRVALEVSPRYWPRLPLRLKIQFGFAQLWYPLFACHLLVGYFQPVIALLTGSPWVAVELHEFGALWLTTTCTCIAPVLWMQWRGWLRPANARAISPEMVLFQLARWPYVALGVASAVLAVVVHRDVGFRITPKGVTGPPRFSLRLVAPYAVLIVISAGAILLVDDPGAAGGYYALAMFHATVYALVMVAVVALHCLENSRFTTAPLRDRLRGAPLVMLSTLGLCVLVLVAIQARAESTIAALRGGVLTQPSGATSAIMTEPLPPLPVNLSESDSSAGVGPRPAAAAGLALDLPEHRRTVGIFDPSRQAERLADFALDHWFVPQDRPDILETRLLESRNRRIVMVTIEPYPPRGTAGPVLDRVVSGEYEEQLRLLAKVARQAAPQVVLVRWGHEMELSGVYPWASDRPDLYREAYRRVVEVFRAEGAANVRWVWSPAGNVNAADFYPGQHVVDYTGLTVLADAAWDEALGLPPRSFGEIMAERYERVAPLGHPIIVAELGVSGSHERRRAWLRNMSADLPDFPLIRALVYFNAQNPPTRTQPTRPDWRLPADLLVELVDAVSATGP